MSRYETLKRDYEAVRAQYPVLKPYDELTDEERAKHEAVFKETAKYFNDLGEDIRTGVAWDKNYTGPKVGK